MKNETTISNLTLRWKIMMRRWTLCIAVAMLFVSASARALPTKAECLLASKEGQTFRRSGKLSEAVQRFTQCMASSCLAATQKDCTTRLKEAKEATPRAIFVLKEKNGPDVRGAAVTVDGTPIVISPESPLELSADPGEHSFEFRADGYAPQTVKLMLRESTTHRESIVFEKSSSLPMPAEPAVATSADAMPAPVRPEHATSDAEHSSTTPPAAPEGLDQDKSWARTAPPGSTGVQFAIRIDHTTAFDGLYGERLGFGVEGGWRITRRDTASLYVGGGAAGNPGPSFVRRCAAKACDDGNSQGALINLQFLHGFAPAERFNPWIGGAIGYGSARASVVRRDPFTLVPESVVAVAMGVDARMLVGIDYRQSEFVGFGPMFDVGLLVPTSGALRDGSSVHSAPVSAWFTVGFRTVFRP